MRYFILTLCLFLTACASVGNRIETAQSLQNKYSYTSSIYQTSNFPLYSARPNQLAYGQDTIAIVIEGDGYAWVSRSQVSGDPTPKNPIGLHIAANMPQQAIYLARPCQYIRAARCQSRYWSVDRFAPDVLRSYNEVISQIKAQYGTPQTQFHLIGFSGGAYLALNMAATRTDIHHVTTIAGLIEPEDWAQHHNITPLNTPSPTQQLLQNSAATHFTHICSNGDKIVPCALTRQTVAGAANHTIKPIPNQNHKDLWKHAIPYL